MTQEDMGGRGGVSGWVLNSVTSFMSDPFPAWWRHVVLWNVSIIIVIISLNDPRDHEQIMQDNPLLAI